MALIELPPSGLATVRGVDRSQQEIFDHRRVLSPAQISQERSEMCTAIYSGLHHYLCLIKCF